MFSAELLARPNRRHAVRQPLDAPGQVFGAGDWRVVCRVTDVSRSGVRLKTYSSMRPGTSVWVKMPRLGALAAKVMWCDDYVAGCMFDAELSDSDMAELTEAFDFQPASARQVLIR